MLNYSDKGLALDWPKDGNLDCALIFSKEAGHV